MSLLQWLLLAVGAGAVLGYAVWWYRTREEPVAGRKWVAVLRAAALLFAWLILLNPSIPLDETPGGRETVAALDASFSMSRPAGLGAANAWSRGLDSLAHYPGVWLVGGSTPRQLSSDSLPAEPFYSTSRLTPAIRSIAASGARHVVVYSDGRLTDLAQAEEEARRRGVSLSLVDLETPAPDVAIAAVSSPRWAQSGDSVEIRVEIMADGVTADSVRVEVVDRDGRSLAAAWTSLPEGNRFSAGVLAFGLPGPAGFRRFVVRVTPPEGDLETRNDARAFYVRVTEQASGPVLISLRPDWEPSFLIDNLDRVTDAKTTAYAWLADSLVTLEGYREVSRSTVQRRAQLAPLLVVHGFGADSPEWVRELIRAAPRVLVFAAGRRGFDLPGWDVRVGPSAAGEWYLAPQIPGSPLALDLGGVSLEALPPLLAVRAVDAERSWSPLDLQRLRRGEPEPAVVLGAEAGRRFAVAAAEGYWRWAFRDAGGRQLYRALWTGVAGWLAERWATVGAGLEPQQRVAARGESLRWTVPEGSDSLNVQLMTAGADTVFQQTAVAGDSLAARLPPGRYRFRARAYLDTRVAAATEGPAEVEEFSEELLPRSRPSLEPAAEMMAVNAEARGPRGSRGLATLGWPYLVLIALFCAEWALRRWTGLR
jgi:hypothetical protein